MHNKPVRTTNAISLGLVAIFGCLVSADFTSVPATAATIIKFDVPDSAGTFGTAINDKGEIAGAYTTSDGSGGSKGFVRSADGAGWDITKRDVFTLDGINGKGAVTGFFEGREGPHCVFYKNTSRHAIKCEPIDALTSQARSINVNGIVTGNADDVDGNQVSFIWDQNNGGILFGVPGAHSTDAAAINDSGVVTGAWFDSRSDTHGFIRDSHGAITVFDVSGARDTNPTCINASGVVAGHFDSAPGISHGFVRDASGAITTFDPPDGGSGLVVFGINKKGVVTGNYAASGKTLGFTRSAKGKITSFDAGGALTFPRAINGPGQITGEVQDASGWHGFLLTP